MAASLEIESVFMKSISVLQTHKQTLIEYLLMKVKQQDWHGVSDAANDIRELDAQIKTIQEIQKEE